MSLDDITAKYHGTELTTGKEHSIDTVTNTGYLARLRTACNTTKSFGEGFVIGLFTDAYFTFWHLNFGLSIDHKEDSWIKKSVDAENKMLFSEAEKTGYCVGYISGFFASVICEGVQMIVYTNFFSSLAPLLYFGTKIATNTFGSYYFPYKRRKERVKEYLQLPNSLGDI